MPHSLDELLAKALLLRGPYRYTRAELEAAEARMAARIAAGRASCVPRVPEACAQVSRQLTTLCWTVVGQQSALLHLSALLGGRIPGPVGARVLGCVLQLAGRGDGARFWWQFAAGAGDGAAAYCLYLHHMTLGEAHEAELWHRQAGCARPAGPGRADERRAGREPGAGRRDAPGPGAGASRRPDAAKEGEREQRADPGEAPWRQGAGAGDGAGEVSGRLGRAVWLPAASAAFHDPDDAEDADGSDPALVLRVLALLRGEGHPPPNGVAAAILSYVPEAVHFVDEIELPLPVEDFAERIAEMTA